MSSIIVANANADSAKKIAAVLKSSGLPVYGICTTGAQVIDLTNRHYHGGVVVCDVQLKDMLAINLPHVVGNNYDFLFLVKSFQAEMAQSLESASLKVPLNRLDLVTSVNMLLNIADRTGSKIKKRMEEGIPDEKAIIKRAKDLLMERNYFTEMQAHRFIQKKSMDNCKKAVETAMIILEMY
ncbi:MAG TPA: ANTAR domain-containing protein [Oscillospiraceae bacterium]|nr:ANTAR domain-containing protein [Oscillospiraceae bacterium]